ncbi:hypothetical protein D3C71_2054130 [compost metagenome]
MRIAAGGAEGIDQLRFIYIHAVWFIGYRGDGGLGTGAVLRQLLCINQHAVFIKLIGAAIIAPPHIHLNGIASIQQTGIMAVII